MRRERELAGAMNDIVGVLREGRRFAVCSHARPDGDALGSVLALGMLLDQMGKQVETISADPAPPVYRNLPAIERLRVKTHVEGVYDAVILLECDGLDRTGIEGLDASFLINIDHHYSGRSYAHLNWIDCGAASVGEMVYRLAKATGAQITPAMARCLYTTLLTDTGGFTYGSVNASTFEMARELAAAGADPVEVARDVCYSLPHSKVLLLGTALRNLQQRDRVSWLWVTHEDMLRADAADEDCEGIVNFAVGIAGIEAAAFLRELPNGQVRISLRSKGQLNVAALAEELGGGGHRNAAGCTMEGSLRRALEEIPRRLQSELGKAAT